MVAGTIANVRGWTTGHCSGSNPKPRFGVRGGAPPSVRSLGWVEDSIDGSRARKILVTARGLVGFVISKKLSCSSHSLRHQPLCSGGGGLHFLCWLGLVSPLMFSPTIPPHWSLTPSDLELGLRSHALRRGTSLPSGPGGWPI